MSLAPTRRFITAAGLAWLLVTPLVWAPHGLSQEPLPPTAPTRDMAEAKIGAHDPTLSKDKFRSLQILHDMPAWQMGKIMNLMSQALGVSCTHCHEGYDFPKEGKRAKDIAREMVQMTEDLNTRFFHGEQRVTCWSCHRGERIPSLTAAEWPTSIWPPSRQKGQELSAPVSQGPTSIPSSPSVAELWARHHAQVGLRIEPDRELHLMGERIEPNGDREREEVWIGGGDRYRVETLYGTSRVVETWDGMAILKRWEAEPIGLQPDEALSILRDWQVLRGEELHARFYGSAVQWITPPEAPPRWRVRGQSVPGIAESVDFDPETGLVVARTQRIETRLGPFVLEVQYADHRRVEGMMIPHRTTFTMPGVSWKREVKQVQRSAIR